MFKISFGCFPCTVKVTTTDFFLNHKKQLNITKSKKTLFFNEESINKYDLIKSLIPTDKLFFYT